MSAQLVPELNPLLHNRPGQYTLMSKVFEELEFLATDILDLQEEEGVDANSEPLLTKDNASKSPSQQNSHDEKVFALFIKTVCADVKEVVAFDLGSPKSPNCKGITDIPWTYVNEMKPEQFAAMEFANENGEYKHVFRSNLVGEAQR